jgi:hypothetical protein
MIKVRLSKFNEVQIAKGKETTSEHFDSVLNPNASVERSSGRQDLVRIESDGQAVRQEPSIDSPDRCLQHLLDAHSDHPK